MTMTKTTKMMTKMIVKTDSVVAKPGSVFITDMRPLL